MLSSINLPGIEALPSPRQGEFFPAKKMSRLLSLSSKRQPLRKIFSSRHGGTQLMSRTNYEAMADFAGHWLHRAQVSLLTGKIGQIKSSHIRKNPGAGLVRASLARSPTDCDTCENLRRRGVGVFDTPTSGDACEGVAQAAGGGLAGPGRAPSCSSRTRPTSLTLRVSRARAAGTPEPRWRRSCASA